MRHLVALLLLVVGMLWGLSTTGHHLSAIDAMAPGETSRIPARRADAAGGAGFMERISVLPAREREAAIVAELRSGNIPGFLRRLRPVRLTLALPGRDTVTATVWAMPDYLAVGSDADFVRVPMSFYTATAVAQAFRLTLPTRKIVDAVFQQSTVRLEPVPMTPGPSMTSVAAYVRHNLEIERARAGRALGELTAGQKKDLVLTKRLAAPSPRVAIYGWHRPSGRPIQPLSTVHGAAYADYSHGVRLIDRTVLIDGVLRDTYDVLADDRLSALISDEGAIPNAPALLDEVAPARVVMMSSRSPRG